jgi:hypothetical protein
VSVPVEQTIEHLNEINSHGEGIINQAAQRLTNSYNNLRRPVLMRMTALLLAASMIQIVFGTFIFWRNRTAINTNWQELTEHSEQQKQEIKRILDKAVEEAKESQIEREAKVKMWNEMIKTLAPQQRQNLISKYREHFHQAEEKRLGDQMQSSYEQMNGTR